MSIENKEAEFIATRVVLTRLKGEIQKSIVGQEKTIDQILWRFFRWSHPPRRTSGSGENEAHPDDRRSDRSFFFPDSVHP